MLLMADLGELTTSERIVIRALRRWSACRIAEEPALPSLVALCSELNVTPSAALALGSLFELTEACLGRPLEGECCCSPMLTADERAVLLLLANAVRRRPNEASAAVPHGLPGVLTWAAIAAKRELGGTISTPRPAPTACPFGNEPGTAHQAAL